MAKSGTAFTASDTITYNYNDRSEVTSADATTDANYNFSFAFDNIGNRTMARSGNNLATQVDYTANSLNQYLSVSVSDASVSVSVDNPSYDDDGNTLSLKLASGDWSFTYNAENRPIVAEKSDTKLEFTYDYQGRRVEKKVYSGSTGNWVLSKHWLYVYDGYLQIEELDGTNSNAILKKHIWGNGKLLSSTIFNSQLSTFNYYYALADANKNITDYLDSTGTVQAHYEYSPFGKITKQTGTMQDDFTFRFSSEAFDIESGLVYYNYRYYSSELGSWLSRDPIEEEGGINLYGMVNNNPVDYWDELGRGYGATLSAAELDNLRFSGETDFETTESFFNKQNRRDEAARKAKAAERKKIFDSIPRRRFIMIGHGYIRVPVWRKNKGKYIFTGNYKDLHFYPGTSLHGEKSDYIIEEPAGLDSVSLILPSTPEEDMDLLNYWEQNILEDKGENDWLKKDDAWLSDRWTPINNCIVKSIYEHILH